MTNERREEWDGFFIFPAGSGRRPGLLRRRITPSPMPAACRSAPSLLLIETSGGRELTEQNGSHLSGPLTSTFCHHLCRRIQRHGNNPSPQTASFRTSKPPPPCRFPDLPDGAAYLRGSRSAVHSEETRTPQHASRHTKISPPRHYANGASACCLHDFTSLISITRFSSRCRVRSAQLEHSGCGKFIAGETNCRALRKNPPGKFIVRNVTR